MKKYVFKEKAADGTTQSTIPLTIDYLQEIVRPFPVDENERWIEPFQEDPTDLTEE